MVVIAIADMTLAPQVALLPCRIYGLYITRYAHFTNNPEM